MFLYFQLQKKDLPEKTLYLAAKAMGHSLSTQRGYYDHRSVVDNANEGLEALVDDPSEVSCFMWLSGFYVAKCG